MTKARQTLGADGEEQAWQALKAKGYRLIERNLRLASGEIDLLCRLGTTLVLIEVKTVKTALLDSPFELIRPAKQRKLCLLAAELSARYPNHNIRIDAVGVDQHAEPTTVIHLENVLFCG